MFTLKQFKSISCLLIVLFAVGRVCVNILLHLWTRLGLVKRFIVQQIDKLSLFKHFVLHRFLSLTVKSWKLC